MKPNPLPPRRPRSTGALRPPSPISDLPSSSRERLSDTVLRPPPTVHGSTIQIVDPLLDHSWDARVQAFPNATVFHSRSWAKVLVETYGYRPIYLVSGNPDQPDALLPLFEVSSWLTGRRGVSVPFSDSCSPLAHRTEDLRPIIEFARRLGVDRKWKYLEARGPVGKPEEKPSTTFHGHRLNLTPDREALFASFESANRRAIRKAEKIGVTVSHHTDQASVDAFYSLLCLTRKRQGALPQPTSFFKNIGTHLLGNRHGYVSLGYHNDQIVAGVVFLSFGDQAIYKYGASDLSRQDLRANNLVMWKAIEHAKGLGCTNLDFGRTSLDNDGLRRFKQSWGTEEYPIHYHRLNPVTGESIAAPDRASGWQAALFQRLPIPVLRLIGAVLYRHIA